jgi:hypothetical protein
LLADRQPFDYHRVQTLVAPVVPTVPRMHLPAPDLTVYDALLARGRA